MGAGAQRAGAGLKDGQARFELGHEPGLAQAGVANEGDRVLRSPGLRRGPCGVHLRQIRFTPDEDGGDAIESPLHALRVARALAFDPVGEDRRGDALDAQRLSFLHIEAALHQPVGVHADQQGARWRALFHASGDVDRVAAYRALGVHAAAQQHAAGVDAHPHVEAVVAVHGLHLPAYAAAFGQQRQAAAHGAIGVVFVDLAGTEAGQEVVSRVLQNAPAVVLHDVGEANQRAVHQGVEVFRVQALAQRGGTHHVQEQDADQPQRLRLRWLGVGRSRRGLQRLPLRLQAGHRHVDDGVAQQDALRLQRCHRRLQRIQIT